MKLYRFARRSLVVAIVCLIIAHSTPMRAATVFWDLNGATALSGSSAPSGVWNATNLFWNPNSSGSGATAAWTANDVATFSAGTDAVSNYTVTVEGTQDITGLTFEEGTVLLTGGTLRIGGGAATANTFTVNSNIVAEIASTIDGAAIGTTGFVKAGTGTLKLSGTNTFSGTLSLTAGTLVVGSNSALGTSSVVLYNASFLQGDGVARTVANDLTLVVSNNAIGTISGASDLLFTGQLVHGASNASLAVSNTGLTEFAGTVTLTQTSGTSSNRFLTFITTGSPVTVSGKVTNGLAVGSLAKNGAGKLVLTNSANDYTGTTTIDDGTLQLTGLGKLGTGTVSVNKGTLDIGNTAQTITTLRLGGGPVDTNSLVSMTAGGVLTPGTGGIGYVATNNALAGLIIGGKIELGTTTKLFSVADSINTDIDLEIVSVIQDTTTAGVTKTGAGVLLLSGTNNYRGKTSIQVGKLAIMQIGNVGSTGGSLGAPTTVADATIDLGLATAETTLLYLGTGESTNRVINLAGDTVGGSIDASGTGALVFTSDLTAASGTKSLTLLGAGTALNTWQGRIMNSAVSGVTNLVKNGTGTWVLAAANTYTGTTIVNGGLLQLSGAGKIGGGGVAVTAGTLDVGNTSQTVASLTMGGGAAGTTSQVTVGSTGLLSLAGNFIYTADSSQGAQISGGKVDLNGATRTFTIGDGTNTNIELEITSIIQATGTFGITKAGLGLLKLSAVNTYSGTTTVSAGTLVIGNDAALGTGNLVVAGIATVQGDGTARTIANPVGIGVSNAYIFTVGGNSDLTFNNGFTHGASNSSLTVTNTGRTTFNGQFDLASPTATSSRTLLLTTFGGTVTINGPIVDNYDTSGSTFSATLTKAGTGTLVITNSANTHFGPTNVSAGQLVMGPGSAITGAGAITVSAGAKLTGEGTFVGNLVVATGATPGTGGTLSPGTNSAATEGIGKLTTQSTSTSAATLNAGSTFIFEFSHAYLATDSQSTTNAGTEWDLLSVAGTLRLGAQIELQVYAMTDDLTRGMNTGANVFDPNAPSGTFRWLFAHADVGIANTSNVALTSANINDYFHITAPGVFPLYEAPPLMNGTFWVSKVNNDIYLNYATVPEPGSLTLTGLAGVAGWIYRRRCKKAAAVESTSLLLEVET